MSDLVIDDKGDANWIERYGRIRAEHGIKMAIQITVERAESLTGEARSRMLLLAKDLRSLLDVV